MKEVFIRSSVIGRIAYSAEKERLLVMFKKGNEAVWEYSGFPRGEFDALMKADSKGTFFAKRVRGKHAETKLGEGDAAFDARWRELWSDTSADWSKFAEKLRRLREKSGRSARIAF